MAASVDQPVSPVIRSRMVVVVSGRVGVQQVAERGEVAAGERSEHGADDIDSGEGGSAGGPRAGGHGRLLR
jgi:hypothetical protein